MIRKGIRQWTKNKMTRSQVQKVNKWTRCKWSRGQWVQGHFKSSIGLSPKSKVQSPQHHSKSSMDLKDQVYPLYHVLIHWDCQENQAQDKNHNMNKTRWIMYEVIWWIMRHKIKLQEYKLQEYKVLEV